MIAFFRVITGTQQHCIAVTTPLPVWTCRPSSAQPWLKAGDPSAAWAGGQAPVPEPPFALPPGPVLQTLLASELLAGPWSLFTTRHEQLHASGDAPTQHVQPPVGPTQAEEASDLSEASPRPADTEADMVEKAALAAESSDSSMQSSRLRQRCDPAGAPYAQLRSQVRLQRSLGALARTAHRFPPGRAPHSLWHHAGNGRRVCRSPARPSL